MCLLVHRPMQFCWCCITRTLEDHTKLCPTHLQSHQIYGSSSCSTSSTIPAIFRLLNYLSVSYVMVLIVVLLYICLIANEIEYLPCYKPLDILFAKSLFIFSFYFIVCFNLLICTSSLYILFINKFSVYFCFILTLNSSFVPLSLCKRQRGESMEPRPEKLKKNYDSEHNKLRYYPLDRHRDILSTVRTSQRADYRLSRLVVWDLGEFYLITSISIVKYETKSSAKNKEGGCTRGWKEFNRSFKIFLLKNEK